MVAAPGGQAAGRRQPQQQQQRVFQITGCPAAGGGQGAPTVGSPPAGGGQGATAAAHSTGSPAAAHLCPGPSPQRVAGRQSAWAASAVWGWCKQQARCRAGCGMKQRGPAACQSALCWLQQPAASRHNQAEEDERNQPHQLRANRGTDLEHCGHVGQGRNGGTLHHVNHHHARQAGDACEQRGAVVKHEMDT